MSLKNVGDYFESFHSDFLNSRRKQQRHYYRSKILRVEKDLRRLLRMESAAPNENENLDNENNSLNNFIATSSAIFSFDIEFLENEMNDMHEK